MPGKVFYIVDAFNLIHAIGWGERIAARGNLHRVRQRLVGALSSLLSREEQSRTTLVFDTSTAIDEAAEKLAQQSPMTLLFSVDYDSADDQIADLLAHHPAPKQVVVVSSDRQVQQAAQRRQSQFRSSDQWYDWLESRAEFDPPSPADSEPDSDQADHPAKDAELSEDERDFWLREFGIDRDS